MLDENLESILARLKSGDKSVLKIIFKSNYPMVAKTIHRYIYDKSLVEDLAQEVFIRLWNKRATIEITSSLGAYLRRMAVNEALAYLRVKKNQTTQEFSNHMVLDADRSAEERYLYGELEDTISNAIDHLPPRCRMIFQMSRFDEMTYNEIANALGISIKTVENQMGKALKQLRAKLGQYL